MDDIFPIYPILSQANRYLIPAKLLRQNIIQYSLLNLWPLYDQKKNGNEFVEQKRSSAYRWQP